MKILGEIEGNPFVVKKIGETYHYFLGEQHIGVYSPKSMENKILFLQNTEENEISASIKDEVNKILEEKSIQEIRETKSKEEVSKLATALKEQEQEQEQDKDNEVTRIAELDLEQEIDETDEEEKVTTKDVNIKQEMQLDNKVTDMKNLGQLLEKHGKIPEGYSKDDFKAMAVIESDDASILRNADGEATKENTTRYQFALISKDGEMVPINLEQDRQEGNNPREDNYQVNQSGQVTQDDVLSRYSLGQGETIAIKNGNYGELKVYHSAGKTLGGEGIEGNQSLDRELETDNVWEIDKKERDLASEYGTGYRGVEEQYQEAKQHENCEDVKTEDVDGNEKTKSHSHITDKYVELSTGEKVTFSELATRWGFFKDGKPDEDYVRQKFEKKQLENQEEKPEDIIEDLDEEYEDPRIEGKNR